jgi:signal-transduction protein with cAMP-binding, CBS, and nucleotidyltransferase domain
MRSPTTSSAAALTGGLAAAMAPPPPGFPPATPLAQVLEGMAAARSSAALALDEAGRPVGILTEQDVARRVAFRLPPEAPLSAAMTAPVTTCAEDAGLWQAVAALRAGRLRHLPVVDAQGRCTGILHRAETLAAVSGRLLQHLDALAGDDAAVKRAQAGVAAALLDEGVAARDVVGLVSGINLDLHRRVLDRVLAEHGAPPVPFTLLVMGSAGRGESLLGPDQDNGFILDDYPDAEHERIDAWFRPMAEAFNAGLAAAGFPLCPGGIMARNPLWRKTLPQWRRQFETWATRRVGAALLFADIAFDFRAAADAGSRAASGDAAPAAALREHLSRVLARSPALLVAMAGQNQGLTVGLTLWGGFTDDEPGEGTRTDLKLHGLMPLVAAARLMALRDGVAATGTPDRLAALAAHGTLSAREAATLGQAFDLLLDTVLRQQLADHGAGATPGNLVDTAALARPARTALRDALKAVRSFSRGSFGSFTGQLW